MGVANYEPIGNYKINMALGEKEMHWQADTVKQWSLLQRENYKTLNEASYTLFSRIKQEILNEFINIKILNLKDLEKWVISKGD